MAQARPGSHPEERMGLLFRSFSQLDSSTTRKYGAAGLLNRIGLEFQQARQELEIQRAAWMQEYEE